MSSLIFLPNSPFLPSFILTLGTVRGVAAVNQPWLPAGPATDFMTTPMFTDQKSELIKFIGGSPPGSTSSIDFTDVPLDQNHVNGWNPLSEISISPEVLNGHSEIIFNLANTFWGCPFDFGNSPNPCGREIRQGIAHLIDKAAFEIQDLSIQGLGQAVDNPVDAGVILPTPNACNWDTLYNGTSGCTVGSTSTFYTGGSAYHLASAPSSSTGAQPNPSLDFCAAAGHFIAAGVVTGVLNAPAVTAAPVWWKHQPSDWTITSATNCQLANFNPPGSAVKIFINKPNVFVGNLGALLANQLCTLFTGAPANTGLCSGVDGGTTNQSALQNFPGFIVSPNTTNLNWWIFISDSSSLRAGPTLSRQYLPSILTGGSPFDIDLYSFNQKFVSGWSGIQSQCPNAGHSGQPTNFMYLCNNVYDSYSSSMEFAPCLSAQGDPVPGQVFNKPTPPGYGVCSGQLSAISAGVQAEDFFGKYAFAIPFLTRENQEGYLNNGWLQVVNSPGGIANYFTWLNAWNPSSQTLRQGFYGNTVSVNPYTPVLQWDSAVIGNIFDSLGAINPYSNDGQMIDYMTVRTNLLCNSASACTNALTYAPPAGTVATYRQTLRSDIFFHDGKQLTSFDVVFSYLSMLASGSPFGAGLNALLAITVLSPTQFDLNVKSNGPFTIFALDSVPILSSAYWTSVGTDAWNGAATSCASSAACFPAQYGINFGLIGANGAPTVVCNAGTGLTACPFSANNMQVDGNKIGARYDPLASGILIGSGPWMCVSSTGVRGGGCTASGTQAPGTSTSGFTLTRFGTGHAPGSSLTDSYFRSSGTVALWFWSGNTGDFGKDFLNFGVVAKCVNAPLNTAGCKQWQQGIGGELNGSPTIVAPIPQASIVARFVGVDMVSVAADLVNGPNPTAPWTSTAIPMLAVGSANSFNGFPAPVLYEGTQTLNPASAAGCTSGYPTGGYDC